MKHTHHGGAVELLHLLSLPPGLTPHVGNSRRAAYAHLSRDRTGLLLGSLGSACILYAFLDTRRAHRAEGEPPD